jgi:geranylgeranyl pyrophosphate synthase
MSADSKLLEIKRGFRLRGGKAMNNARKKMVLDLKDESFTSQALRYFAKVTLRNALPVFPALISMSCEAVGGDVEKTTSFGEAIVLLSAAADLHDDVIDQSFTKGVKQTVLGKFNAGTAILAGDILLVQGFKKLTEAAEAVPKNQSREIINLFSDAVKEICIAEALEIQIHNKADLTPAEFHEAIRLKAVVPELSMKVGAILGDGSSEAVNNLGHFGRTYGINSIIIEEFMDMLNSEELRNRIKNECPPLPIIYAIQNPQIKANLGPLLDADTLNESDCKKIVEPVLDSCEVQSLQKFLSSNAFAEIKNLPNKIKGKIREELENLLLVPLSYFEV